MSMEDRFINSISKWTYADLKADLIRNNVRHSGNKRGMAQRLQSFYRQQFSSQLSPVEPASDASHDASALSSTNSEQNNANNVPTSSQQDVTPGRPVPDSNEGLQSGQLRGDDSPLDTNFNLNANAQSTSTVPQQSATSLSDQYMNNVQHQIVTTAANPHIASHAGSTVDNHGFTNVNTLHRSNHEHIGAQSNQLSQLVHQTPVIRPTLQHMINRATVPSSSQGSQLNNPGSAYIAGGNNYSMPTGGPFPAHITPYTAQYNSPSPIPSLNIQGVTSVMGNNQVLTRGREANPNHTNTSNSVQTLTPVQSLPTIMVSVPSNAPSRNNSRLTSIREAMPNNQNIGSNDQSLYSIQPSVSVSSVISRVNFVDGNNEQITPSSGPIYTHNTINNVAVPNSSTVSGDDQSLLGSLHHTVATPTTQPYLPNPTFPGSRPDRSMPVFSSTHVNTNEHDNSASSEQESQLKSLEMQLKIVKAKDEIRTVQCRLTLTEDELRQSMLAPHLTSSVDSSMLELVRQSVDMSKRSVEMSELPPAKPFVFSGDIIQYPKWKSMFELFIESKELKPHQKLIYLEMYLEGKALECIKGYNMTNSSVAYADARQLLDKRFGDPYDIADAYRDRLEKWPKLSSTDSSGLQSYADFLRHCHAASLSIPELSKLDDPRDMKCLPNALPEHLLQKWSRIAGLKRFQENRHATFKEYQEFVQQEAFLATSSTTSVKALTSVASNKSNPSKAFSHSTQVKSALPETPSEPPGPIQQNKSMETVHALAVDTEYKIGKEVGGKVKKICHMCRWVWSSHDTSDCSKLRKLSFDDIQAFMKQEHLCFSCLRKGHGTGRCRVNIKCLECSKHHATCLHDHQSSLKDTKATPTVKPQDVVSLQISSNGGDGLTTMILPVYVSNPRNPDKEVLVYALVDNMSNTSFILRSVADELSLETVPAPLGVTTIISSKQLMGCRSTSNLRVRGLYSNDHISIPKTHTADAVPGLREHIPTPDTAKRWPHLAHLHDKIAPLQSCEISMLIGYNCADASEPIVKVRGGDNKPYAVQTVLGWSIVGGLCNDNEQLYLTHKIIAHELTPNEVLDCLSDNLETDRYSVPTSQNDRTFLKKMEENITCSDGHYTMPLPFKKRPTLPANRKYALRRFRYLEKKLNSDPQLYEKYKEFMDDIISKGEAELSTSTERGWYIPHFGVFNPQKPGKLRVVFDCSATCHGQSLNQHLLQGPDLNNNLAGLLCRFRKDQVALTCDVQKMFHQFRVNPEDRRFIRFLWYKDYKSKEIVDFQMNVHLFGAVSSPSCAIFGLKQLAKDFSTEFPNAASFIQENFYVDDGLISLPTADGVINLVKEAKALTQNGSLVLHKFLSNNAEVAAAIGCDGPSTKDLNSDPNINRALGLSWDIDADTFKFSDHMDSKAITRRGILSSVASVFDPLGFLTPFTLKGKLLIQDLCKEGKGWDEPISTEQEAKWKEWVGNISAFKEFNIRRCFLDPGTSYSNCEIQLHVFSDASSYAYGMCAYIRIINRGSKQISMILVMGKSRVGPKRAVTIPRLELQAATLGVKIGDFLIQELKYPSLSLYYWTDSKTVLGYISNDAKKFHTYVSNRVQRIRDSSSPQQWRYVASKENPADMASRGGDVMELYTSWLHGPEFLSHPSLCLNTHQVMEYPLHPEDPEIKRVFVHAADITETHSFLCMFDSISEWVKVGRIISHILKFIRLTRKIKVSSIVSDSDTLDAITIMIQRAYFPEELDRAAKSMPIVKSSSLFKLDPFLDSKGILRVGGRLRDGLTAYRVSHPAVLPAKAHLTQLFCQQTHRETAHQGKWTTINHVRNRGIYLVGQGSRMIGSLIQRCVKCTRLRGRPIEQKMADLPEERTEPSAPFCHVGMDVFGPYTCRDGRKEVKRYGLIFTCLSTRAVHIEVLNDMTSDCFINSLRCLIAIRGPVQSLHSDQGTNFVGGNNEFNKSLKDMMSEKTQAYLRSKMCSFNFNVPAASHMGGVWERLIRVVRNVFNGLLVEKDSVRLDTTNLRTLFYECMAIINSRPLTTQQLAHESSVDPLPLSPNMLLTMKSESPSSPPGDFDRSDLVSRKSWRRIQYLAEQFWARWKLEYLNDLQKRQKWNTPKSNVKIDDIVLLCEDESPRSTWKMARVINTLPSADSLVRKVTVKVSGGQTLDRPVQKLIMLLPTKPNQTNSKAASPTEEN